MNIYDKMTSILKTLDIDLVDNLVKRGHLKLDLDDLSVTFCDTFLTQELVDETQKYLYFVFCALYLIKNRTYLFIESVEDDSYANLSRELKISSTYGFETSPKQAIDEYFYQYERRISEDIREIKDTKPQWAFSYKIILIKHCTAEEELHAQLGIVKTVNFTVYMSDIPSIIIADTRDEENFYDMDVPLFCHFVKSNAVLSIDNAFNLHSGLSLAVENSSVTIHEDFAGATQEYCRTLTGTLLNRNFYTTQPFLPTVNSTINRYQSNPKLGRSLLVSPSSELRSWILGPQLFTQPTATPSDEGDLRNFIMEANDFISFVNIGAIAEDYSNLEKLSDRSIGKFLIGHTYIIDEGSTYLYNLAGGCHIKVFVQSIPVSITHSKLISIEESSERSIMISAKEYESDMHTLLGSGFLSSREVQEIAECAHVKELIRELDGLLGEGKYYLTLLCLNRNQLLDGEARDNFRGELINKIIRDLQYTTISYSLDPL